MATSGSIKSIGFGEEDGGSGTLKGIRKGMSVYVNVILLERRLCTSFLAAQNALIVRRI